MGLYATWHKFLSNTSQLFVGCRRSVGVIVDLHYPGRAPYRVVHRDDYEGAEGFLRNAVSRWLGVDRTTPMKFAVDRRALRPRDILEWRAHPGYPLPVLVVLDEPPRVADRGGTAVLVHR